MHKPLPVLLVEILSAIYLATMMFALGLELGGGPKESKDHKRAKRRALMRGLLVNLVLLPLVAFGITRAVHAPPVVTAAVLLLAASPGGKFTPQFVKLGGGDTALSVELTLFLAKLTCFTAIPTVKWMLTMRTLEIHELPFLLQIIALQLVPFYSGKWLRGRNPARAEALLGPTRRAALAVVVVILAMVLVRIDRRTSLQFLDARGWIAVVLVGTLLPAVAWLFGGAREGLRRTFAISATAQELGLAVAMASATLPSPALHAAIFGIFVVFTVASFVVAWSLRFHDRRHGHGHGSGHGAARAT
jgi:BASS family bile acid:Na+ symporter